MLEIRVLTPSLTLLGENPLWDVATERLYWIDVFGAKIFRSTADGREICVWSFPGRFSALALRVGGGAITTAGRQILLYDFDSGETELVFEADNGFNDGKVDRQGRFVSGLVLPGLSDPTTFGQLDGEEPRAGLYRVDSDLSVHLCGDGVAVSNGPCFSPDGRTLYWSDSGTRRTYAWDYDPEAGEATGRRMHADFYADNPPGEDGLPDGATVDEEGYHWVASFFGREVRRYAPDGALDRRVALPVHSPTSVAFGGPELDVLFVTTMGMDQFPGTPQTSGPVDGTLLAVHGLGVRGVPETRFAG